MNILVPLLAMVASSLLAGGGWSYAMRLNRSFSMFLSTSFLFSAAIAIFSWDWLYQLGGDVTDVNILIFITSSLGWVFACFAFKKRLRGSDKFKSLRISQPTTSLFLLAIAAAFFFGVFPKMDTASSVTMAFRTGPDAIGTAIASDALFRDGSKSELIKKVLSEAPTDSLEDLFGSNARNVYKIPSLSQQVKAEFILTSSPKIGFTGVTANLLSLIGMEYLWSLLALLPTLSLLFGIFLIFECLTANKIPISKSMFAAIGGSINVNALHIWHEGSLAQSFVFLPVATIFILTFSPNDFFSNSQKRALGIASAITIFSHTEIFLILVATLLISIIITSKMRTDPLFRKNLSKLLIVLIIGATACGPFFATFMDGFASRLGELGPSGWMMPVWPRISDIYGLVNPYNRPYPNIGRTPFNQVLTDFFSLAIVSLLTIVVLKAKNRQPLAQSLTIFIVFALVLVKVVLIDHATNYQYVKAIGVLAPFLLPLLLLSKFDGLSKNLFSKVAMIIILTCIFVASTNYTLHYRQSATRIGHDLQKTLLNLNRDDFLNEIDFISRSGMEEWTFAPFVDLRLIGRGNAGVDQTILQHKRIGLILKESECKNWLCLRDSPKTNVYEVNAQYRILLLDATSKAIYVNNKLRADHISIINRLSLDIGGPTFNKDFSIKPN